MDSIPESPTEPFNGLKQNAPSPRHLKKQPIKYNQSFNCKTNEKYTKTLAGNASTLK